MDFTAAVTDQQSDIAAEAGRLIELGWNVIPVDGKKPALPRWRQYQERHPSEQTRQRWLSSAMGIGVVLGAASGHLVCRDFDDKVAFEDWMRSYPELVNRLPVARTGRGGHVYATCSELSRTLKFDDGELRGPGGITVLPPSPHPDGHRYLWLNSPPQTGVPLLSLQGLVDAGLLPATPPSPTTHHHLTSFSPLPSSYVKLDDSPEEITDLTLSEIIDMTLPNGPGERHRAIFNYARLLRSHPSYADTRPKQLDKLFRPWHDRAVGTIQTKDYQTSLTDFGDAWERIRWPIGNAMSEVMEQALQNGPPPELQEWIERGDMGDCVLLASICRELQRQAGDEPFFLDCRTAGRCIGKSHTMAAGCMRLLQRQELIGMVEEHKRGPNGQKGQARRYRYLGTMLIEENEQ